MACPPACGPSPTVEAACCLGASCILADEDDFILAFHQVFRSAQRPSRVEVGVLPPAAE